MKGRKRMILERLDKNKGFIFLMMFFSILSSLSVSYFWSVPEYQASTQILIGGERQDSYLDKYTIQDQTRFLDTYSEIIKSPVVLEKVENRTGNNLSVREMKENITIDYMDNSQVFNLSFQHEDYRTAVLMVNEITAVFSEEAGKVMNANSITILTMADAADEAIEIGIKPGVKLVIALIFGLSAAVGLVFILPELNTTVTTNQEASELLMVPVLGNISPIKEISQNQLNGQKKQISSV